MAMDVIKKKSLQEIIKGQFEKCATDEVYFMKKYCQIQHPTRGRIPFTLYDFQEDCIDDFKNYQYNIILKSRQLGLSTLIAGYALHKMTFKKDYKILVIATGKDTAINLINKVTVMYNNLPSWMKISATALNKMSLEFKNGSSIKAVSSKPERARSEALSLLIIDEAAFVYQAQEIWTAAQQTLATGGDCVILSCVTKDTYVFTDRGIKQVDSFIPNNSIPGDYKINSYNIFGNNKLRTGNLFHNNGKVKTYKIITKLSEIEGSFNHKLWACKDGEYNWFELKDLSIGDWVNVQYGMDVWGNNDKIDFYPSNSNKQKNKFHINEITNDVAYLIGLYLSEGSSYKVLNNNNELIGGSITITCGDDLSFIFNKLELIYSCYDGIHYNISSKNIIEFFEYIGFDLSKHAHEKEIPERLLELSKEKLTHLLSGIFDGDGFSRKDNGVVGIGLSSKKLIQQIRMILLNMGIRTRHQLVTKEQMNEYNYFEYPFKYDSHRLEFNYTNSLLFYDKIGFRLNRKQVNKFLLNNISNNQTSFDVIPYSLDIMNNLFNYFDKGMWTLNKKYGLNINGILSKKNKYKSEHINSKNVIKMYEIVKDKLPRNIISEYDKIIIPNSEWVQIKKIEESENETFDFSLNTDIDDFWSHSILYNGIIGHQTPNGMGNWFHDMWMQAEEGSNGFYTTKLKWDVHPERDQSWRDEQDKKLGKRKAAQECDADFLTSGNNVVDLQTILFYEETHRRDPEEKRSVDKGLWVWQYPDYTKSYLIGADVARGDGSDYSACHVFDIESMEQVAEYKGHVGTRDYGRLLATLGVEYNNAMIIVERENVGWDTIQELIDINYPNLFYSSNDLQYVEVSRQITNKLWAQEKNLKPGFGTTSRNRGLLIQKIERYFEDQSIIVHSTRLLNELKNFIWHNGKAQAQSGKNDDLVMALGILLWVRDTALRLRQEGMDLTRMTLNKIGKSPQFQTLYQRKDLKEDPYKQQVNRHETWNMKEFL